MSIALALQPLFLCHKLAHWFDVFFYNRVVAGFAFDAGLGDFFLQGGGGVVFFVLVNKEASANHKPYHQENPRWYREEARGEWHHEQENKEGREAKA